MIVDLSRCDFIDSTVISMLQHTETIVALHDGRLVVALPGEESTVTRLVQGHQVGRIAPDLRLVRCRSRQFPDRRAC